MRSGGVVGAVLPRRRIPVRAGAGKVGRLAASDGMNMNAVNSVRKAGGVDPEGHASRCLHCADGADRLPIRVDERHGRASLRFVVGTSGKHGCGDDGQWLVHDTSSVVQMPQAALGSAAKQERGPILVHSAASTLISN